MTGPCGVGKSWLSCALGHKACRETSPSPITECRVSLQPWRCHVATGGYTKMLSAIARLDLLILDDWRLEPLDAEQRRSLLEIAEDRYEARSIIVASQLPVDRWYELIGNPTIADAILDRLVHNAYRIDFKAEGAGWLTERP
nr:ATP-binding protein [Sphingomonas sp. So64.6b]